MIRRAGPEVHEQLTRISFAAKGHWQYPGSYMEKWRAELTVSEQYISMNKVFVHCKNEVITGYYGLVELPEDREFCEIVIEAGLWLDHMFVDPQFMGVGIGRQLYDHCVMIAGETEYSELRLLVDPNAAGFYRKMGCQYVGEYPSTIAGRTTPCYRFSL